MKKLYILTAVVFIIFLLEINQVHAQGNEWLNQVIIANGGKFESPPYSDFATVQKYDPVSHTSTVFDKIYTQSVQDVIIDGHFAYVAAQDSIVKYDIDTYQRVAAVADSGLAKLYKYGDKLLVSKQYPIKRFFLEVLDDNLSILARVQNISGECGGIISGQDTIYVAVNGGYSGTEGKLAHIKTSNWTVVGETNFGTSAVGIWNLYNYSDKIYSVNRTPTGIGNRGSITIYNIFQGTYETKVIDVIVGDGAGIKDNLMYLKMNEGLGSFDLNTKQIVDTTIIKDPGSVHRRYITSAGIDYVNDLLYVNIGNRSTYGVGEIATLTGDSLSPYTTGINADAIALDFRAPVGISNDNNTKDFVSFYPNPVTDFVTIKLGSDDQFRNVRITDLTGRVVLEKQINGSENTLKFNCENLHPGIYLVSFQTDNGMKTRKFVKR